MSIPPTINGSILKKLVFFASLYGFPKSAEAVLLTATILQAYLLSSRDMSHLSSRSTILPSKRRLENEMTWEFVGDNGYFGRVKSLSCVRSYVGKLAIPKK